MNWFFILFVLFFVAMPVAAGHFLWRFTRGAPLKWKLAARIPSVFLFCVSVVSVLALVFVNIMCGRYEFEPAVTVDGNVAAQVTEEDCGGMDSFHTSVRMWHNHHGSRFFFKEVVFGVSHDPRLVDLKWKDSGTLVIRYPNDSRNLREFNCQSEWNGIHIECVGYKPDYSVPVGAMPPVRSWPYW
jgi:hypothetical protein